MSLELVLDKKVREINVKLGGRICSEKEIVFVETANKDKKFMFRFSLDKSKYSKCKYAVCGKQGLIDQYSCICGQISYCSEACRDKDNSHKESCEVLKKREFDP